MLNVIRHALLCFLTRRAAQRGKQDQRPISTANDAVAGVARQ
jgi:hypothetical protein